MAETKSVQQLDCGNLTAGQINDEIKKLSAMGIKNILVKNAKNKKELFYNLSSNVKIEMFDGVSDDFGNKIHGLKLIINGNVGDNSALNASNSKFTVFGSCGNYFGHNLKSSEVYILENCGSNSFYNFSEDSKLVLGGLPGAFFVDKNLGGTVIILNLKGGNMFIEESWFNNLSNGHIYVRGEIKNLNNKFKLIVADEADEDIYLPLISEFSRLLSVSLSKIKSKQFHRLVKIS